MILRLKDARVSKGRDLSIVISILHINGSDV